MIGKTLVDSAGREVVVTQEYAGDAPSDPPGYYYRYVGETKQHWISAGALPIRFRNKGDTT